ncbi:MAG: trypsin-like peptidase domain-containing protein [Lachnospiraceae bacterium]|nr:trypsin-like peptidase domain-containing protein [Lachnospiraceae bacterium]
MNKKLRLILCVLFILFIGIVTVWRSLIISNGTEQQGDKEMVLGCQNMVIPICCEGNEGNATFLCEKEDGYILCTAAHVVSKLQRGTEKQQQIKIEDELVDVRSIWISETYDVAFLEIPKIKDSNNDAKEDLWEGKLTTGLSQDGYLNLKEGDILWAWSYFDEEVLNLEIQVKSPWIYIEDFGYHMIWGTAEDSKGGMSGSGVFDREGRLAGILCGGNETEVVVLPMNIILGELKNSSIDIFFE